MSRTNKPATSAVKTAPQAPTKGPVALTWKERLHPEDYEILRNTFDLFDADHSGFIDPEEINKIMEELGEGRKGTLVFGIIEGLNVKNKPISFDEFVELVTPKVGDVKTKEGLKAIFKQLDKDDDDYINYDELKQLSRLSGDIIND
jgi:calmodulin